MLSIIATAYLQAILDVCTPYIKYVCIDIAMDLVKAQAAANKRMKKKFQQEDGVPQFLYGVVIFIHKLCKENALTWDYTTDGTLLHVTLSTSRASVFTVRLFYGQEHSVVIQKNWNDKPFDTIDELKVFIEDRIERLERYDLQPGKERSIFDAWLSLDRLVDILHYKLI